MCITYLVVKYQLSFQFSTNKVEDQQIGSYPIFGKHFQGFGLAEEKLSQL
jgi:hypothetical protein